MRWENANDSLVLLQNSADVASRSRRKQSYENRAIYDAFGYNVALKREITSKTNAISICTRRINYKSVPATFDPTENKDVLLFHPLFSLTHTFASPLTISALACSD